MITPFFRSSDRAFTLLHGDCIELLKQFSFKFDMIFPEQWRDKRAKRESRVRG